MRHQRRRPRPSADVLRHTDVTKELVASRDLQQINKAVDSILGPEEGWFYSAPLFHPFNDR